jgi:protein-tyrosine-phosphatase
MKKRIILFVCKYNRFRSKVAEAYFNSKNKDKKIIAKSLGIIGMNRALEKSERERNSYLKKKFGLKISQISRGVRVTDLVESDKIIVVANDVPKIIFDWPGWKNRVEVWEIPDVHDSNIKAVNKSVKAIMKNIDKKLLGR